MPTQKQREEAKQATESKSAQPSVAENKERRPVCVVTAEVAYVGGRLVPKGTKVRPNGDPGKRTTSLNPDAAPDWQTAMRPADAVQPEEVAEDAVVEGDAMKAAPAEVI